WQLPRHEPGRPILAKCCLARRRRGRRVAGPPGSWFLRGFGWATDLESLGSQRASVAERDRWGAVCRVEQPSRECGHLLPGSPQVPKLTCTFPHESRGGGVDRWSGRKR